MSLQGFPDDSIKVLIAEGRLDDAERISWEKGNLESVEYLHALYESKDIGRKVQVVAMVAIGLCSLASIILVLTEVGL